MSIEHAAGEIPTFDLDRAELRRLLAESARPGEVFRVAHGHHYSYAVHDRAGWTVAECAGENWAHLIAAAVNALPGLLDALEKAEWQATHEGAMPEC